MQYYLLEITLDRSNSSKQVKLCPITDCSLYIYCFGHNLNRKNIGNADVLKHFREEKRSCAE
jgi:hypothetical protein